MTYNEVLQIIISKLGENYNSSDQNVLENILKEKINQSSYISNREIDIEKEDDNLKLLSPEIIEATIIGYQERGTEYTRSQSELGVSNTFIDVDELLRNRIIKNGKRVMF